MGQYYKTSQPTFVENFMYTPPWELYKEVIATKDKAIDDGLSQASQLEGALDFDVLDFDKEKAEEKKLLYKNKIEDISNKIRQDPENFQKYSQDIYAAQKEILKDFTDGEISAMTKDYAGYQKFIKDHEKFREKEGTKFNAGLNAFYNEAKNKRDRDGYISVWNSEQLQETIDFRKGFVDFVSKVKPTVQAYANTGTKGGYIFKEKGTQKSLTEAEVQKLMKDYIETTPNVQDYERQNVRIGLPTDFDGLMEFSKTFAYTEQTADKSQTVNSFSLLGARTAASQQLEAQKQANRIQLINHKAALAGGKKGTESYNGEVQQVPVGSILGSAMMGDLNYQAAKIGGKVEFNKLYPVGLASLISGGIISKSDGEKLDKRLQNYTKSLNNFGNKQIVFVPESNMRVTGTNKKVNNLQAGKTYILTAQQAKNMGIVKGVVENSAQPFYISDQFSGARFNFTTPEGGVITGSLMPPGSNSRIKEGLQIFK